MDIFETIKKRRSVRIFDGRPIPKEIIEKIIEAGIHAPSNCNTQGWRFIVVDRQDIKDKIYENGGAILIKNAPLGILVTYDNRTKNLEYKDYIQSAAAAMENIFLAATELGVGCCWINHLPTKRKMRKIFNIPTHYSPIGYFIMGYAKKEPGVVARKHKLEEMISYNEFGKNLAVEKINPFWLTTSRTLAKIYYFSPLFLKKMFLNKLLDKYFVKKFEN